MFSASNSSVQRATLIGLFAPICWGMSVSLIRGIAIGVAYAAWTHGMSKGNITILAAASYFTPVLSCVFAMFWINAQLDSSFWSGVALVVIGSLLCWDATERGVKAKLKNNSHQE